MITPENVAEVVPRFFGLSSRDAAAVAASIRPVEHPPLREVVTVVRESRPTVDARQDELRAPEMESAALSHARPGATTDQLAARRVFGDRWMHRYTRDGRAKADELREGARDDARG